MVAAAPFVASALSAASPAMASAAHYVAPAVGFAAGGLPGAAAAAMPFLNKGAYNEDIEALKAKAKEAAKFAGFDGKDGIKEGSYAETAKSVLESYGIPTSEVIDAMQWLAAAGEEDNKEPENP